MNERNLRFACLSLAGALMLLAGTPLMAGDTAWVKQSEQPVLNSDDSEEDNDARPGMPNLCEDVAGILSGLSPGWVRVNGSSHPANLFTQARGQVLPDRSLKSNPYVAHTDFLVNHYSQDFNVFLTLDPPYRGLLGTGNFGTGEENEHAMLEIEWERDSVPQWAWPASGDRLIVWGHHIWDCGHATYGHRTEIHPPVGWVVLRNTANLEDHDGNPRPEKRTQNPWVYYEFDDRQGIGSPIDSWLYHYGMPVQATVADVFFSSFGGNAIEALNGCDDDGLGTSTDWDDAECLAYFPDDFEWMSALLNQDYEFFIPAPPKPVSSEPMIGEPTLLWEDEDRCATVTVNPGNNGEDIEWAGEADDTAEDIGAATCNIPYDVTETTENGVPGIKVKILANSGGVSYPANNYVAFARRFKVAWDWAPAPAGRVRTFQTDVQTLRVWDDADECGTNGEWAMLISVGEQTRYPVGGVGEGGLKFYEDGAIDDDKAVCGGDDEVVPYTIGETFVNHIVPGQKLLLHERSFDFDSGNNNFLPHVFGDHDASGTYTEPPSTSFDIEGAHQIQYTMTELTKPSPTPGTLVIGTPSYGPNADTGGASTRVREATPITLNGTSGTELQYRYWRQDLPASKPLTWLKDVIPADGLTADLFTVQSGFRYVIEYRPATPADAVVGIHRTALVEVDDTAPQITTPGSLSLPATNAYGRIVDYTVTALDNLPGPITLSCIPPTGSFFKIRQTTPVSCTATDAVGNSSTGGFNVEVHSPFGYIPDFVALGRDRVHLGVGTHVVSGNVGTFQTSGGILPNWPGFEVVLGSNVAVALPEALACESARLEAGVTAGPVFTVDLLSADPSALYTPASGGYVPLFPSFPEAAAFDANGPDVKLKQVVTFPQGNYGNVTVMPGAQVTLSGGSYLLASLEIKSGAVVQAAAPSTLYVEGGVRMSKDTRLEPAPGSGVAAHDLVIWVAGADEPPPNAGNQGGGQGNGNGQGKGKGNGKGQGDQNGGGGASCLASFCAESDIVLGACVDAQNGTVRIGPSSEVTGALLGTGVEVGEGCTLTLDSIFDVAYP